MDEGLFNYIRKLTPTLDKNSQFMFFEIKKAATTSVRRKALKGRCIIYKNTLEKYYDVFDMYSSSDINNMFKFTIVRNPYARVLSAFIYLNKYRVSFLPRNIGFKKFVKDILFKRGTVINPHLHEMTPNLYFNGELIVDFVARLESIDKDWPVIARRIGVHTKLPHKNKGIHKDYRNHYDKDCIKIVSDIYAEDLKYFNYKF